MAEGNPLQSFGQRLVPNLLALLVELLKPGHKMAFFNKKIFI
jgi:hypothetical protein